MEPATGIDDDFDAADDRDDDARKGRSTAAEISARVDLVFERIIEGATRREILAFAREEMGWGVSARQVDAYIAEATRRMKELAVTVREEELGRAIAQLHDLYGKCVRSAEHRDALAVRRELSLLLGLHAPSRHELTGKDGEPLYKAYVGIDTDRV